MSVAALRTSHCAMRRSEQRSSDIADVLRSSSNLPPHVPRADIACVLGPPEAHGGGGRSIRGAPRHGIGIEDVRPSLASAPQLGTRVPPRPTSPHDRAGHRPTRSRTANQHHGHSRSYLGFTGTALPRASCFPSCPSGSHIIAARQGTPCVVALSRTQWHEHFVS